MATDGRKRIPSIRAVPESLADEEGTLDFLRDVHRLFRAVSDGALGAAPAPSGTGGTTPVPGPPGPIGPPGAPAPGTTPDLTPPPTPTGLVATAGFANVFIQWDVATYTQGRGNLQTNVYGAKYSGTGPLPTFSSAVLVGVAPQPDTIFILPTELSTQWHIWIKFQTRDGVESVSPAGGANGASATTGKIGNADLGPLIVEAGNLASGAVTAAKLAAGAVEFTKFAAGLEPVGVVGSLPVVAGYTGPRTVVLTTDGKLYRLVAGAWTAAVPAADVTGQLSDAQIASIAAAKLTGQIIGTQITDGAISTPKLAAGSVTTAALAAGSVTTAVLAAGAVTAATIAAGAITTPKLAAGAVTASELAAESVTTAKIAAGAVNAAQIAAGAIRTDKLLVTGNGAAINDDPNTVDLSAWIGGTFSIVADTSSPTGSALSITSNGASTFSSRDIPLDASKNYNIRMKVRRVSGTATCYLLVAFFNASGALLQGSTYPLGWAGGTYHYFGLVNEVPPASYTEYQVSFGPNESRGIPPGTAYCRVGMLANYDSAGEQRFTSIRLTEKASADLIVDGSIIATKLAANAIAVGSAAIQNGAIVNAMIANGTIDDAKIATLSAGKITAGSLGVGSFIQSNDYVSGVAGWRISGSGFAELGAASIRGQLSASQLSAWSISAGRAIIADGTISTAKIEDASITNAKIGDTIESVGYSPGASGWRIRKSDGFAEFGAATIRGKLSAGNIVGVGASGAVALSSLAVSSGQVSNQSAIESGWLNLDTSSLASANVSCTVHGELIMLTNASFAGGNGTYKCRYEVRLDIEGWNGSSWVSLFTGVSRRYSSNVILTGSEEFEFPVDLNTQANGANLTGYSRLRAVVYFVYARFLNLTVNGGAIKTDALNTARYLGTVAWRQHPN